MKKKILFTLISTLFIFSASACKRRIRLINDKPTVESVNKIGKFVKNYNLDFNDVTFKQNLEDVLEEIKGSNLNYDEIYNLIYKVYNKVSELNRKFYIADALYNYDMDNIELEEKREILSDSYYEYEKFVANITYELKDNRELLKELLGVISDEDLDYEIELATKKKEEKYINLKKDIDDISEEFDKLDTSDPSKTYQISELLYNFVNKNKELSEYLGFDSYIEYKDIEYKRTYTISDSTDFISNVKKYILPKIDSDKAVIPLREKVSSLSYPEYNYLIEFDQTSVFDKDYKTLNLAKDYSKKIGGDYYKTFNKFLTNGNYVFASGNSSLDNAYTNPYLSFFGEGYQNVNTLIHEFGHYYSSNVGMALYKSLDMEEFYSQANEFLFISYLEQNSYSNVKNVYDVLSSSYIDNACLTMLISSSLREFEQEIYTKSLTSPTDITKIWNNLNQNEYNNMLDNYWRLEIRYDNYYLSYGTSATGALALYSYSKTNLGGAIEKYVTACKSIDINEDLVETLNKIDINGPFSEEAFKQIEALIIEKRK